jgi:hypothetical protein
MTKVFSLSRSSHPAHPWRDALSYSHPPPCGPHPNACCTSSSHPCRTPCSVSTTGGCNLGPCGSSTIHDRRHNRLVNDASLLDSRSRGPYPIHGRGRFPVLVAVVTTPVTISVSLPVTSVLAVFVLRRLLAFTARGGPTVL